MLNQVQYRNDSIVINKDGKPVAALVDADLFARIQRMRERFDANVLVSGLAYPGGVPGQIVGTWRQGGLEVVLSRAADAACRPSELSDHRRPGPAGAGGPSSHRHSGRVLGASRRMSWPRLRMVQDAA